MSGLSGLDDTCGACRRRVGDHTMDEYDACLRSTTTDLAYEEVPDGPIPLYVDGNPLKWADHLYARSAVVGGQSLGANLKLVMPTVIFNFQFGNTKGQNIDVAEVAFVGSPETLRKLGKVLRDTCNGAANAAERAS